VLTSRSWAAARRYATPPLVGALIALRLPRQLAVPLAAAAGGVLLFFRDPDRPAPPRDPALVYAPSDGVITSVSVTGGPPGTLTISTYLSLWNVHVARCPVDGVLQSWEDRDGRLGVAWAERASEDNRRARLMISFAGGGMVVDLIAGALARRISRWVTPGARLAAGDRLGIIHFGSRTDVVVAARFEALVSAGDRVRGGCTPIARLRDQPPPAS
jgi:phosphatidylserine decarboxylase